LRKFLVPEVKFQSVVKKPPLPKKHVKKKFTWAKENLDRNWDKVIFSENSSFWTRFSIYHTWSTHTNRLIQRIVKGSRLELFLKARI